MAFPGADGQTGQTGHAGQGGQNTGRSGKSGHSGQTGRPSGQAAGNQAVESLADRLYQMYMLQFSSAASVTVSEAKKRERMLSIINYVAPSSDLSEDYELPDGEGIKSSAVARIKERSLEKEDEEEIEAFAKAHEPEIKAIQMQDKINAGIAKQPTYQELQELAAQKMILYQGVKTFLDDGDQKKLGKALEKESFNARASEMMDSAAFKKMCSTLGPHGLAQAAKGNGEALVSTFAKMLETVNYKSAAAPEPEPSGKELSGPSLL